MTRSRNSLADQAIRRARVLAAEGRIAKAPLSQPGTAFTRQPGDILVSRTAPDGTPRGKEAALVVARRQDCGATYRGSDARWFVFARQGLAGAVSTERARRTR